jgi:DNA repair protein RecN (Recombination protein N)
MRSVVSQASSASTVVFDEVDAGVGGRVAEAIGVRLVAAARQSQVICVTHLPQIAAFADTHFRVEKLAANGRTRTHVARLDADARRRELARMLGGSETSARAHAETLLGLAARAPSGRPAGVGSRRGRAISQRDRFGSPERGGLPV